MTESRPLLIGVGGSYHGVGKSSFATLLLRSLKRWGAIKYSPSPLYSSIIEDTVMLSEEGKDTQRFLDAGAEKVLLVRSPRDGLDELISLAIAKCNDLDGVLIEGNAAIMSAKPDIVIFVCGNHADQYKKNLGEILSLADVVIFDRFIPPGVPVQARKFHRDNISALLEYITEMIEKQGRETSGTQDY